jgi:hypothetical protein
MSRALHSGTARSISHSAAVEAGQTEVSALACSARAESTAWQSVDAVFRHLEDSQAEEHSPADGSAR